MNNKKMIKYAEKLRDKAAELEAMAKRPLPEKWAIGQTVRIIKDKEWCCNKGCIAKITRLREEYEGRAADEYQVFYTSPINGNGSWWTTPDEVELVNT